MITRSSLMMAVSLGILVLAGCAHVVEVGTTAAHQAGVITKQEKDYYDRRAQEKDPSRLVPHYRRQPPSVRTVVKPPSPEVPSHLRLARISLPHRTVPRAVPQNPTAPDSKDPVETSRPLDRRPPPSVGPSDAEVQESAFDAADWAAHGVARTMGWREYYRAGLYDGQRSALADAGLGRAEYEEGRRAGRFDPAVRDVGSYEGSRAAEAMARREAPRQVERQFLHLTWAMIPSPRPPIVAFDEPLSPSAEPSLEEVFHDFPYTGGFWASPRLAEAYHGWSFDPWRLYQCANHTAFFDARLWA